jgi:hypothetical protein
MTGKSLRLEPREVEVHSKGNMLSREEDMIIIIGFLIPEVEEEEEEE